MAHDDKEATDPGLKQAAAGFDRDDEAEGTEEVTQVDSPRGGLDPGPQTPAEPGLEPFANLDEDTLIPTG